MSINKKILSYIILLALYIIIMQPILYLSILLIGKADIIIVICFGIINTLYFNKFFKNNTLLNLFLGFFISSFSICFTYLIWFLRIFLDPFFGAFFFIIISFLLLIIISKIWLILKKYNFLVIMIPTLVLIILSFKLKEVYPTKFENENLTTVQIQIVDKQKKSNFQYIIKARIDKQPLFGMKESHEIFKIKTDENGFAKMQFSKSKNYTLFITDKDNKFTFFDITAKDLKHKKTFIIEYSTP